MIRKYVPFALGGIVVAMIAAAGIPSPRSANPLVKRYAPAPKKASFVDTTDDEDAVEEAPPAAADHFSKEWHERFRLTPQAAIHREPAKQDGAKLHAK